MNVIGALLVAQSAQGTGIDHFVGVVSAHNDTLVGPDLPGISFGRNLKALHMAAALHALNAPAVQTPPGLRRSGLPSVAVRRAGNPLLRHRILQVEVQRRVKRALPFSGGGHGHFFQKPLDGNSRPLSGAHRTDHRHRLSYQPAACKQRVPHLKRQRICPNPFLPCARAEVNGVKLF
ncbi:hypothetical protein SDC9_149368 [bioreactor metagenome]|uniref:Uncharacterized protein n=1 Tax=bioreactor metagenome TaxID=1076179 RepID=A0A645EJE8_9ZZZZ